MTTPRLPALPPASLQRRLAAILAADVVGFSRLMGADEEGTLGRLKVLLAQIVEPAVAAHNGRIFKTTGDGLLAEYSSVVDAVRCAVQIQTEMASRDAGQPPERRLVFRVGINLGDILVEGDDIYGDGVNIAARIESICEPGGIAISASSYEQVRDKIEYRFVDRGLHDVKNIARPVHVYGIDLSSCGVTAAARKDVKPRSGWRWRVLVVAFAVLVAAAGGWIATSDPASKVRSSFASLFGARPSQPSTTRATIAVLPFSNQSGDAKRDYFSEGITEDIINALGRFSSVMVISRNAVQAYKGGSAKPGEISRDLGVRYIAQGSVRQADGKLRVAVELSDAEKGTQLWSERYEGEGKEVFEIQDRIVRNIVGALAVKLTSQEQQRASAKPAESLEAYDLVLRARDLLHRGGQRSTNREARAMLTRALELAPNYAEGYLAMSQAEYLRAINGWMEDLDEGVRQSVRLAERALAIDDPGAHARAHALLSRAHVYFGKYDQALSEADRAIEMNVSDSEANALRAQVLLWLGKIEESIASHETARRFDPRLYLDYGISLSLAYYMAGRYQDAIAATDSFLARYPHAPSLHGIRAASFAHLGNAGEAQRAAELVKRANPLFQVEQFATRFVNPEHTAKIQEGLRKAGL